MKALSFSFLSFFRSRTSCKTKLEKNRKHTAAIKKRIDNLYNIATVNGENEWMLTMQKKGDSK